MALEVVSEEVNIHSLHDPDELLDQADACSVDLDARRRLEDKIEEMRLRREMQEFDFDD